MNNKGYTRIEFVIGLFLVGILTIFVLFQNPTIFEKHEPPKQSTGDVRVSYKIVVIDGCEYVLLLGHDGLSTKANQPDTCK